MAPRAARGRRQILEDVSVMKRLRTTWLALMGGALLVTLSLSAAFGAPPPATDDGPKGLSVSGFVHQLIFGEEAPDGDPEQEEEQEDNSETELEENQQLEELVVEDGEPGSHGACVSEVAHDKAGENDPEGADYANHGERVSEAARDTCWEDEDEEDPEVVEEVEVEELAHGECVSGVAHDKDGANDPEGAEYANHGERVSEAARFLCWEPAEEGDPELNLEEQNEDENEESDAGSTGAGPGKSGEAGAHGKANAPGQQKVQAGDTHGGPPSWAGQGGRGDGGNGGGGR
jgi:hypothetical protein